jgi:predicted transcriptional regulator
VQKLLERLEAKGYVTHRRSQGRLLFAAALGRDDLIGRRLQDLAAKLCGGSLTPLLLSLVRSKPLTADELEELRAVLEERRRGRSQDKPR